MSLSLRSQLLLDGRAVWTEGAEFQSVRLSVSDMSAKLLLS